MSRFEHRGQPLLPWPDYRRRVVLFGVVALALLAISLAIGILGYHYIAGLSWIDALLNAAMILGGMGPMNPLTTVPAKLFASFYALFAGVVFLLSFSVFMTPIVHRFLHGFHIDIPEDEDEKHGAD